MQSPLLKDALQLYEDKPLILVEKGPLYKDALKNTQGKAEDLLQPPSSQHTPHTNS